MKQVKVVNSKGQPAPRCTDVDLLVECNMPKSKLGDFERIFFDSTIVFDSTVVAKAGK